MSGAAIAATSFTVTQCPKYTVLDSKYSEASYGTDDSFVYGVNQTGVGTDTVYETGVGWVGVTCLLYTSPSPRDVEESRMPSSA